MPRASCAGFSYVRLRVLWGSVPLAWYIADKGGSAENNLMLLNVSWRGVQRVENERFYEN